MIIDKLENLSKYTVLNPLFADVVKFVEGHDLHLLEPGKYPLASDDARVETAGDLFLNLSVAKGRSREAAVLETHVRMIDIQVPLSCEETFGYTPLSDLPAAPFDAEKDIAKYGDTPAQTYVTLKPGQMAIFFPEDGHAPCIAQEAEIKKAIFKVKVI